MATVAPKKGKKVKAYIKLNVPAGMANPAPPVGPALGQHGVPLMDFCKEFNARTQSQTGSVLPVVITVYEDRTFTFITKTPLTADLIKKSLNIKSGSATPNKVKVGKLSRAKAEEIAKVKMVDLNARDMDEAVRIIEGTARSMGVEVEKA